MTEPRVDEWERRSEWPLTGLAILFLVAYAWPILQPDLAYEWVRLCRAVNYGTWILFALEYAVRVGLASRRWRYVERHVFDLVVVALPIFRPLRLLRLVLLLQVLNRRATESFRGKVAVYVCGSAVILIVCASLAVLDAERGHSGSNIHSFGTALWWAISTVTTVGYGDHFPVTVQGRGVAVGLMIAGLALLGVVTATLASWLIDRVREVEEQSEAATRADIATLTDTINALRRELTEQRWTATGPP